MSISAGASALIAALALQSADGQASEPGIAVQTLGAIHPLEVDGGGDLPGTVWSSGDAAALDALMDALPDTAQGWSQPGAARLALGALLSGGAPPADLHDRYGLAAKRAQSALAVGRPQPVQRLLARTPDIHDSQALSRLHADLSFALGQTDEACRTANALMDGRDTPYWLRARAICLAVGGNIPAAELTAELARAQGDAPGFDPAFDALTLGTDLADDYAPATALQLALGALAAPQRRLTPSEDAPAWLHRAAARTGPAISLPQTLPEALEAAVAMQGEDRAVALGALLQQELDRDIAAEALAIRLNDAAEEGAFVEAAMAYGAEVARLPLTADTLAHGRLFVLAALAADDVVAAQTWRDALMDGSPAPDSALAAGPDAASEAAEPVSGPSALNAPPGYAGEEEAALGPDWTPPPASVLAALDFARAVAAGQIDDDDMFAALLGARLETPSRDRLCQAAMLSVLGADAGGALRTAMTGLTREADAPSVNLAPGLLAASAGAIGESALHASLIMETAPGDGEACAGAAVILQRAGLEARALRLVLEMVLEDAA